MACIIVPAAEAVITTIVNRFVKKNEAKNPENSGEVKFSDQLGMLNRMLWGGSGLLAFEHVWHGEITPSFPFLTNAANPADAAAMFSEMAVSGTAMAAVVTLAWAGITALGYKLRKNTPQKTEAEGNAV